MDRNLLELSGPWSYGSECVLHISQSPSVIRNSASDCLVSYPWHSLAGVLLLCWDAVGVFYIPSRLGNMREGLDKYMILYISPDVS